MWLCPSLRVSGGPCMCWEQDLPEGTRAMPPPETFVRGLAENHCLRVTALAVSHIWSNCLEEISICWWKAQHEWSGFPKGCVVRCGKKLVKEMCERIPWQWWGRNRMMLSSWGRFGVVQGESREAWCAGGKRRRSCSPGRRGDSGMVD